jgi:hypothetical protein
MVCYCGVLIPPDAKKYPCKRSRSRGERGPTTVDDYLVRCVSFVHPPGTEWNYLSMALERGKPNER